MGIAPNRLVAVLTPLVFAPLAGTVSVLLAEHFPGLDVESDKLQQIFIAGALIAFGKAGLWLKGWQDWEKGQGDVPADVADDVALEAALDPGHESDLAGAYDPDPAGAELGLDPDEDDFEDDDAFGEPSENGFAAVGGD